MKTIDLYNAFRAVDDDILERSETASYERKKKSGWLKWGAMAACFSLILVCFVSPLLKRTPNPPANRPIAAYIQEDVNSVTAIYTAEGNTVVQLIEGEELNRLRTWTNDLRYILIADSGKEPPLNTEIKEKYEFIITEGDYPGYSYMVTDSGDSYLLIEGYWYFDPNPSKPPIAIPSAEAENQPPNMSATANISGTIKFYYEPTKEFTEPVGEGLLSLNNHGESQEIIKELKAIITNVDEWVDDYTADRDMTFYFNGEIQFSDSDTVYYFSYEYRVIYYDHYYAEITEDEMQYIRHIF